ncbi:MAG: glycoside hydrolase family 20 zincin-like fold domain-containing protein [Bacteroidota bacterium]
MFTSVSLPSCIENNRHENLQVKWSSRNAYNIPYRLRLQKFEDGNLVQNNGFESGKYYEFNTKSRPFDILNWKKTSDFVEWVDIQNGAVYDSSEVHSGTHAVKIIKPLADETEEKGEGIMSEFIRVIPGKYHLSLYVRLENIKSAKARLGTRLYDAVDIRLIYYDKNKLEINPNIYSEFHKSHINTSFKGYSFSNFNEIDSLGWTEVYCESAYPPFPDGYIPDNARFVKVFIGLKGSGILWADDINLSYTADNFSLTEKLAPYFEATYDAYDLLMPGPKSIEKLNTLSLSLENDSLKSQLALKIPKNQVPASAMNLLMEHLEKYDIEVVSKKSVNQPEKYKLVIDVPVKPISDNAIDSTFKALKKKGKEAYSILCSRNGGNVVKVISNSPDGYFNAFSTLIQLIDTTENNFYKANITDWPSYTSRNLLLPVDDSLYTADLGELNQMGYNDIFTQSSAVSGSPPDNRNENLVYRITDLPVPKQNINEPLKKMRAGNADNLIIYEDIPSQLLLQPGYESLHRNVYSNIVRADKNTTLYYKPLWNNLYVIDKIRNITERFIYHNSEYLQQFDYFLWAGNALKTSYVDNLDLIRIKDLLPIPLSFIQPLFPNTLNDDTLYILDGFIPRYKGNPKGISNIQFIAPEYQSVFSELIIRSAADYLWNPESFSPEFALFKALNKTFNRSDAVSLIRYSTLVSQIKQVVIAKQMTHTMNKWTRQEENLISELSSVVRTINESSSIQNYVKQNVSKTSSKLRHYYPGI